MLAWALGTARTGSRVGKGREVGEANRHGRHCPYPERKEDYEGRQEARNERVIKCVCEWRQEAERRPSARLPGGHHSRSYPAGQRLKIHQALLVFLTPQTAAGGGAEVLHGVSFEVSQHKYHLMLQLPKMAAAWLSSATCRLASVRHGWGHGCGSDAQRQHRPAPSTPWPTHPPAGQQGGGV